MNVFKASVRHDEHADLELLNRYRQSADLTVLANLYQPYMPLVYGVCLKYLKDEDLCKDAVMQLFEELIDKVKKHEIKHFRGWLYVLTRNYCLMQLRHAKKTDLMPVDEVMENSLIWHPDHNKADEETIKAMERCMEKLPAAQKQSINLFYYDEKCYKEVAEQTGYTLNEVKSYIQNGKRNLKICLEKNGER